MRPIWLNKGFFFFPDHFGQWEISPKLVWNRKISWLRQKKTSSLINLVPSVPSFHICTKFRLKSPVTTVHLLQCKTKFFIHLRFWGRNLLRIKEHLSWETCINIKKRFFDSFTLVYFYLHSSSNSFTLVFTGLRSSTIVYICLHSSCESSVFLKQIEN